MYRPIFAVLILFCLIFNSDAAVHSSLKKPRMGAAISSHSIKDKELRKIFLKNFTIAVPENEMKWEFIHPQKEKYDFSRSDEIFELAKNNNIKVKGHTLVWCNQLPDWIKSEELSSKVLEENLKQHIFTVLNYYEKNYPGIMQEIDVVNEAFDDQGNPRECVWTKIGNNKLDYVLLAFKWAHEADPNLKLFYNDYGYEFNNQKTQSILNLLKNLQAKKIKVDGLGMQMHYSTNKKLNFQDLEKTMEQFSKLNLEIHFSEVDFPISAKEKNRNTQLKTQESYYLKTFSTCLKHKQCSSFLTWGVSDKYSWLPSKEFPHLSEPLMFDKNFRAKPMFVKIKKLNNF